MSTQPDHSDLKDPDEETLCFCSGTRRKQIRELYQQGKTLQEISEWTGAMSGCGGCEWDIEYYLEELAAAQAPAK